MLFRLTETSESSGCFTDNVIHRYNNTQNPVNVADFFANDQIQVWLRDNITRIAGHGAIPNVYYIHNSATNQKALPGEA